MGRLTTAVAGLAMLGGALVAIGSVSVDPAEPLRYTAETVDGRLALRAPPPERRVGEGERLTAGTLLRTGWWSSATITAEDAAARFEVGPRTTVRLSDERPGLLLEVERGRVHALFDRLDGSRAGERLVETPTAVLAVRGTEYGVAVDRSGATQVVVFEGEVEVTDRDALYPPVRVRAGHHTQVRLGAPPSSPAAHGLDRGAWDRGAMPHAPEGRPETGRGGEGRSPGESGPGAGRPSDRPHGGSARHGG